MFVGGDRGRGLALKQEKKTRVFMVGVVSRNKKQRLVLASFHLHAAVARPPPACSRAALAASCAASRATAATPSTLDGWPVDSLDQRGTEEDEPPPPPLLLAVFVVVVVRRKISKAPTARTFLKTTGKAGAAEGEREEDEDGDEDGEEVDADERTERNLSAHAL